MILGLFFRSRSLGRDFTLLYFSWILAIQWGCHPSPQLIPCPVDLPLTFSQEGEGVASPEWWTSFGDKELHKAMEMAFAGNLTLAGAWDRLNQAEAVARRDGALRTPALTSEASTSRTRERKSDQTTYSSSFLVGLMVSYEVDLWGRLRSAHEAARFEVKATEQDVYAAALSLSAKVATAWYELAEALEQLHLLDEQVETNRQILTLVTEHFRQGRVQSADVLRQRQWVLQTEALRETARRRKVSIEHQIAVLLGRPPKAKLGLSEPRLPVLAELPCTGLPSELLSRRPDVTSAYLAVLVQDRRLASALANRYPKIGLSGNLGTRTSTARDLFDDWFASLAGNLAEPIFDAGGRKAEVDRHRALRREAFHRYGQTLLTALQEVEDALAAEIYQREILRSLQEQIETSRQLVERTRLGYINGQFDYLRVLDAVSSSQNLTRQMLGAHRELVEIRIQLHRALAGSLLLERPEIGEDLS